MGLSNLKKIEIDLKDYKIHLYFPYREDPLTLFFNTNSRKFYFSLIALIVNAMKDSNKIRFVSITSYVKDLSFLDRMLSGKNASKKSHQMLEKIRKTWRDPHRLSNLKKGSCFKILHRDIIIPGAEIDGHIEYKCTDKEADVWANLISYDNTTGKKWFYKFALDEVGLTLDDVKITFDESEGMEAWNKFIQYLSTIEDTVKNEVLSKTVNTQINNGIIEPSFNYAESLHITLPPLPQYEIIGRKKDLEKITEILKNSVHFKKEKFKQNIGVVQGLPGVGKTTLSILLCHDPNIKSLFKDGIIWTVLGKNPDPRRIFKNIVSSLNLKELNYANSIEEAELILGKLFRKRNFLIVVDDVWNLQHFKPFLRLSKLTPILLTTRLPDIAYRVTLNAEEIYKLDILSESESLLLLKELVPTVVKNFSSKCKELVVSLEGLPLAIRVAGHLLRMQSIYGLSVPKLFNDLKKGSNLLKAKTPNDIQYLTTESSPTVAALLKRSTDSLTPQARRCFSFFGHLPSSPAHIDYTELSKIWNVEDPDIILNELLDFGLIEPFSEKDKLYVHYLMTLLAESLFID